MAIKINPQISTFKETCRLPSVTSSDFQLFFLTPLKVVESKWPETSLLLGITLQWFTTRHLISRPREI